MAMMMAFPTNRLLEEISNLKAVDDIEIAVDYSTKSGLFVGSATAVSGMVGGPVGLALGGIISSCAAYCYTKGKYQSIAYTLLHETTNEEKEKLAQAIRNCLSVNNIGNWSIFAREIRSNEQFVRIVVIALINALRELGKIVIQDQI